MGTIPSSSHAAVQSLEGVITAVNDDGRASVQTVDTGALDDVRVAVMGYRPVVGDRVVLTQTASSVFVIGVVASAAGGVQMAVEDGVVVLRSEAGEVVLRHDPEAGETRLGAAAGDLLLEAPQGTVRLSAKAFEVDAETITQRAHRVLTIADQVAVSADRWDLRVHRIKERAHDAIRRVDGVLNTRAGRLRTVVATTAQLLAKRTSIRSEEDTAIDGRQVLLG